MAFKGIDVRQTSDRLVFRAFLQDDTGALVTSGTTTLKLYELQSDGTLKSYDFADNTFKTTALTTETLAATHRKGNNATTNTGLWTAILTTLTGFTSGNIYFALVNNTGAAPADQVREFQFGGAQGDLKTPAEDIFDVGRAGHKVTGTFGESLAEMRAALVPKKKVADKATGQTAYYDEDGTTLMYTTRTEKGATDNEVQVVKV